MEITSIVGLLMVIIGLSIYTAAFFSIENQKDSSIVSYLGGVMVGTGLGLIF